MIKRILAAGILLAILAGTGAGCASAEGMYIGKDGKYYRNKDGENHVGFLETSEGIYYFDETGRAVYGEQVIDGKTYLFDEESGVLIGGLPDESTPEPSAEPSAEPSDESPVTPSPATPSSTPSSTPTPPPTPSQEPADASAAVGPLTGNERLDKAVKEVIDEECSPDNTAKENLWALFDWMVTELKYKYVSVDLSNGYTEDLVNDLAEYVILNRRGSCEHQAALMAVFNSRLGYASQVVAGTFLSDDKTEWVEHAWAISEVEGSYYHFDPLFGRNHTSDPKSFFMKKDADIEALHRWDRSAYPVCD